MNITIRDEEPGDHAAVRSITIEAFNACPYGHNGEADLIERLRAACNPILFLVACTEDDVVGHVLFSPIELRAKGKTLQGMGLAPMSVAPKHQRAGVGKLLVTAGLQRLVNDGCPFVVVLGHPAYYSQFGFAPAGQFGISHGFSGIPQDVFFIKPLSGEIPQPTNAWKAFYRNEFGPQHLEK